MRSLWVRKGKLLSVPQTHPWWHSHIQVPVVLPVSETLWRVYVAARDNTNHGTTIMVELDPSRDFEIRSISQDPLLHPGPPDSFDSRSVGITSAHICEDRTVFAGGGMRLLQENPYEIAINVVESYDRGATLNKVGNAPIMAAGPANPFGAGMAHLMFAKGQWHLWFTSFRSWFRKDGIQPEPRADIRHAISDDLLNWTQDPEPAIALSSEREGAVTRASVLPGKDGFEMWFSTRGRFDPVDPTLRHYRIGYATSTDGTNWTRRDREHGFLNPPQPGDWDHQMQCYATVVTFRGATYMIYCGNDFGQTTIGYAIRTNQGGRDV